MHEGPISSDSFLFGATFFGPKFKHPDRVISGEGAEEQYAFIEHLCFRVVRDVGAVGVDKRPSLFLQQLQFCAV